MTFTTIQAGSAQGRALLKNVVTSKRKGFENAQILVKAHEDAFLQQCKVCYRRMDGWEFYSCKLDSGDLLITWEADAGTYIAVDGKAFLLQY